MSNKQKQIAIDAYDISKIYQLEMLYYKCYDYERQNINGILTDVVNRLKQEFIDELHEWHLSQPEGLLELINNPNYHNSIWEHSNLSEPEKCSLEGPYRQILITSYTYKLLHPQGNSDYTLYRSTYGIAPQQKPKDTRLAEMLKGLKRT